MNLPTSLLKALPLGVLFVVPALIAACNNGEIPIGQTGQQVTCQSDSDCPAGQACDPGGHCAHTCLHDADCAAGQVCHEGLCGDHPACAPSEEVCDGVDNDCDGVVDNGAHCGAGMTCHQGACAPAPCVHDADCGADHVCHNGVCEPGGSCVPHPEVCDGVDDDCDGVADNGADCGVGMVCHQGACAPAPCVHDADCGPGHVCHNGTCEPGGSCVPQPEVCDGIDDDCDGVADNGADCGAGMICHQGACAPAPCVQDSDCGADHACHNGMCIKVCVTDADCPAGQSCHNGACQ